MTAFFLPPQRPRSIVYVDGFNLYYGAVRGTPHKWLNLSKFFRMLRPADDIRLIRYFSSLVTGHPPESGDFSQGARHTAGC